MTYFTNNIWEGSIFIKVTAAWYSQMINRHVLIIQFTMNVSQIICCWEWSSASFAVQIADYHLCTDNKNVLLNTEGL